MNFARLLLFSLVAALLGAAVASAQDTEDAVKARMQQRLADVTKLQVAGLVGENNRGFLEQRGALAPEQTQVMNAENADRRALYNILATRLGYTVAEIGVQRAIQIRNNAPAGVWIQEPTDGSWKKK